MEKLKEYIYIYSGTFKEEGGGRNHFPFSYFDRFHGCKKLKHRKIAKWSTGVEKFRGGVVVKEESSFQLLHLTWPLLMRFSSSWI